MPSERRRIVVQAGGRVGLWPITLASVFQHVITFEPEPLNYECLVKNVEAKAAGNVEHWHAALGAGNGFARLEYSTLNDGSHQIVPGTELHGFKPPDDMPGPARLRTIDSLALPYCDLIMLDVEGYEIPALQGGGLTIGTHRPVLVLEENTRVIERYRRKPGDIEKYCRAIGYELVERYQNDLIFSAA